MMVCVRILICVFFSVVSVWLGFRMNLGDGFLKFCVFICVLNWGVDCVVVSCCGCGCCYCCEGVNCVMCVFVMKLLLVCFVCMYWVYFMFFYFGIIFFDVCECGFCVFFCCVVFVCLCIVILMCVCVCWFFFVFVCCVECFVYCGYGVDLCEKCIIDCCCCFVLLLVVCVVVEYCVVLLFVRVVFVLF